MKIIPSKKALVVTLILVANYASIAHSDASNKEIGSQGTMIFDEHDFRPFVTNLKMHDILQECGKAPNAIPCEQDLTIHFGENTTTVSTGFKSIDDSAPRDIKGYIYSMATSGELNKDTIKKLDEWIESSISKVNSGSHVAFRVPEELKAAVSPLLYPERGDLYLVFSDGEISASIKSNSKIGSFTGYKYYERGQFIVRAGPILMQHAGEHKFFEVFPTIISEIEQTLSDRWPGNIQRSKLNSIIIN